MNPGDVLTIEQCHDVDATGGCRRCRRYLGRGAGEGEQWNRDRLELAFLARGFLRTRKGARCPYRAVAADGATYTADTIPVLWTTQLVVPVAPDKWDPPLPGIGYWRSEDEPDLPDPRAYVRDVSPEAREALAQRLEAGRIVASFRGYSDCRICGKANGSCSQSDGRLVWPGGLSHYVRDHGVWFDLDAPETT